PGPGRLQRTSIASTPVPLSTMVFRPDALLLSRTGDPWERCSVGATMATAPPNRGFSLITVLLWMLLMGTLVLLLHVRLTSQFRVTAEVDRQLYSLILAENGVEYARTILPHLDLNDLLSGLDGVHSGVDASEWRNPMPLAKAREIDPSTWLWERDDGLPFFQNRLLLPGGYRAEGEGYFFLRFSNNPEESPESDEDFVVLVRSLGLAPSLPVQPSMPSVRNNVSIVEARFRQETTFALPSPLTLLGDSGTFQWEGENFTIDGGDHFGVSLVEASQSGLEQDFQESLTPRQWARIQGQGSPSSLQDATQTYREKRNYQVVFRSPFWKHFEEHLPEFSDPKETLRFLPEGGVVDESLTGVLVARGNLTLQGDVRLEGLLLHLGGGRLELRDGARVNGAIWMSNVDASRSQPTALPLWLSVRDSAAVVYEAEAIRQALAQLPPTQLGWRILFPEMQQ
ncbi:MAG: hypothetical protein ACE5JX_17365, partial [Acidobacteriota bacterium]